MVRRWKQNQRLALMIMGPHPARSGIFVEHEKPNTGLAACILRVK